jgi:hypothetical protein
MSEPPSFGFTRLKINEASLPRCRITRQDAAHPVCLHRTPATPVPMGGDSRCRIGGSEEFQQGGIGGCAG